VIQTSNNADVTVQQAGQVKILISFGPCSVYASVSKLLKIINNHGNMGQPSGIDVSRSGKWVQLTAPIIVYWLKMDW